MTDDLTPLKLDLVEWVAKMPRRHADVMAAWGTSCPRLPVWEDSVDAGYLARRYDRADGEMVEITAAGRAFLAEHRRAAA